VGRIRFVLARSATCREAESKGGLSKAARCKDSKGEVTGKGRHVCISVIHKQLANGPMGQSAAGAYLNKVIHNDETSSPNDGGFQILPRCALVEH